MDNDILYRRSLPPYSETPKYSSSSVYFQDAEREQECRTSEFGTNPPPRQEDHEVVAMSDMNEAPTPSRGFARSSKGASFRTQLPSHRQNAMELVEECLDEDGSINVAQLLQEFNTIGGTSQRRRTSRFTVRRKSSAHGTSVKRRRTTVAAIVDAFSNDSDIQAREEMKGARSALKRVKTRVIPLNERVEIAKEEQAILNEAKERLGCFSLWYALTTHSIYSKFRSLKDRMRDYAPWDDSIKLLAGKHGAAVGMFFTFTRWSLYFNLLSAIFWISFVVIPYASSFGFTHSGSLVPSYDSTYSSGDTFIGLFTGGGALNFSAYFIGSYIIPYKTVSAGTAPTFESSAYNVPIAYLLTCGFYLTLAFIFIFRQVYWAVYNRSAVLEEGSDTFSEIVLTHYDYSLMDGDSVNLKRIALVQLLRESLDEVKAAEAHKSMSLKSLYLRRILVNFIVLSTLAVSLYIIYLTINAFSNSSNTYEILIPTFIVSIMNVVLPVFFEQLAIFEKWRTDLFVLQLTVIRSTVMRATGLIVFMYTVFLRRTQNMCWESFVGQYIYNLFIVVLIVEALKSLGVSSLQSYFNKKLKWKAVPVARFDTVDNAIDLLYAQTIILFGSFFCPLLPLLGVLRCIILFYIKKWITLRYCEPPIQAFRARFSFTELFYVVLTVLLFLVAFPLGYAITRLPTSGAYMSDSDNDAWISLSGATCSAGNVTCADCLSSYTPLEGACWKVAGSQIYPNGVAVSMAAFCAACPSGCGPFRNQPNIYQTAIDAYSGWSSTAQNALGYIATTAFAGLIVVFLILIAFYLRAKAEARKVLVQRMRLERDMERMDKIWILQKYEITLDDRQ